MHNLNLIYKNNRKIRESPPPKTKLLLNERPYCEGYINTPKTLWLQLTA